jgi:hypothetical protein
VRLERLSESDTDYADTHTGRAYFGLTQVNQQIRYEFSGMYTASYKPSVYLNELSPYIDAFPVVTSPVLRETCQKWLDASGRGAADTLVDLTSVCAADWSLEKLSIRYKLPKVPVHVQDSHATAIFQALMNNLRKWQGALLCGVITSVCIPNAKVKGMAHITIKLLQEDHLTYRNQMFKHLLQDFRKSAMPGLDDIVIDVWTIEGRVRQTPGLT